MNAPDVPTALRAAGVVPRIRDDRLVLSGPTALLGGDLVATAREHKPALLALLRAEDAGAGESPADPSHALGYHPALPPVPCCTTGTPAERVLHVLTTWAPPEGWTLDRLAHRAGLTMEATREGVRALLAARRLRFDERAGRIREGAYQAPIVRIRLRELAP